MALRRSDLQSLIFEGRSDLLPRFQRQPRVSRFLCGYSSTVPLGRFDITASYADAERRVPSEVEADEGRRPKSPPRKLKLQKRAERLQDPLLLKAAGRRFQLYGLQYPSHALVCTSSAMGGRPPAVAELSILDDEK